ncbi:MAG: AIM24 family protein, partial [Candidatus Electrothrix sp. AX5]|nr:AIM24 family protein [Candidatus Electrothrix sp. AX5]
MNMDLLEVIETEQVPGAKFEVVQYKHLKGSDDLYVAEKVFFAKQAEVHLKMIRITLEKSEILIEPGALYFMKGYFQLESNSQGLSKGLMRK